MSDTVVAPPVITKRFVVAAGRMQYNAVKRKPQYWRLAYTVDATCEIPGCPAAGMHAGLVFDHCHQHGWVRAVLCPRHNSRMGALDAVRLEDGIDLTGTVYGVITANCHECAI